jgi:hypothetical protein
MERLLPSFSSLLVSTVVCASDIRPVDLRLTALLTPKSEPVEARYTTDAGTGAQVDGAQLGRGWRLEAGLVTRLVDLSPRTALVGGGWVFYGEQESDGGQPDAGGMVGPRSYLVLGIDAYLAWRLQFSHHVGMEIGPLVGAGTTRFSDYRATGSGFVEETGHGEYQEAAMNLQILLRNTRHTALLALGVRYLVSYGEADNRFTGVRQDVEVSQNGPAPFVSLGMTF